MSNLPASVLDHLVELPQLESLEVGDCAGWTDAGHYAPLGKLARLKHLRMEQGPSGDVWRHLEAAIRDRPLLHHLELINFNTDQPLDGVQLAGLKRLLIIPIYSPEVIFEFFKFLLFPANFYNFKF